MSIYSTLDVPDVLIHHTGRFRCRYTPHWMLPMTLYTTLDVSDVVMRNTACFRCFNTIHWLLPMLWFKPHFWFWNAVMLWEQRTGTALCWLDWFWGRKSKCSIMTDLLYGNIAGSLCNRGYDLSPYFSLSRAIPLSMCVSLFLSPSPCVSLSLSPLSLCQCLLLSPPFYLSLSQRSCLSIWSSSLNFLGSITVNN